jgi:hypothetical protein
MTETNRALRALAALPANTLIQFPSGAWGFVGMVDPRLAYRRKDGAPISAEEINNVRSFGMGLFRDTIETVAFPTREAALDALASLDAK